MMSDKHRCYPQVCTNNIPNKMPLSGHYMNINQPPPLIRQFDDMINTVHANGVENAHSAPTRTILNANQPNFTPAFQGKHMISSSYNPGTGYNQRQRYLPYYNHRNNTSSLYNVPPASGSFSAPPSSSNMSNNNVNANALAVANAMIQGKHNIDINNNGCINSGNFQIKNPNTMGGNSNGSNSAMCTAPSSSSTSTSTNNESQAVWLQISNLDSSFDEASLKSFLINQLISITPVIALSIESASSAKVKVPSQQHAKVVVSNMHRKKIGHKRIVVAYSRESTEMSTLRCQVAGLLKDVPQYTLSMYKFRELFQARFKTSINVLELYKMGDICVIETDSKDEKFIRLHPDTIHSIENNPMLECLQHSVPYCTVHFQRDQHKGWAEQDIEQLPNVLMTLQQMKTLIFPLLRVHKEDIPIASLMYCIEGELNVRLQRDENGVNLEHLVCCINGVNITTNKFGIKILTWLERPEVNLAKDLEETLQQSSRFFKSGSGSEPLHQISREVIELIKMAPKSTLKFNRFIPAYHNHFGKQCRVADYGYTRLIELFDALSSIVQVMGDGENRQLTLTHRTQMRRFTSDLLRVLRSQANKSIWMSQLPKIFSQVQMKAFDITDYGVCDIVDVLDGLVNNNVVVVNGGQNGNDILISIPKRKQTSAEIENTFSFAAEVVELLRRAAQFTIPFEKFVRSYHYHFGYQCKLSDYGFTKLADLMDAIHGVVEIEVNSDEDRKIYLCTKFARRVFSEQLNELIKTHTKGDGMALLDDILAIHKKKYGYQLQPQSLGAKTITSAIEKLPYIELMESNDNCWIVCHHDDKQFRLKTYAACRIIITCEEINGGDFQLPMSDFQQAYEIKFNETLTCHSVQIMRHAIAITTDQNGVQVVGLTPLMLLVVKIIKVLDKCNPITYGELKMSLGVPVTDCFDCGYPNILTILQSFSDIFIINNVTAGDFCEIATAHNMIQPVDYSHPASYAGQVKASTSPPLVGNISSTSSQAPSLNRSQSDTRQPFQNLSNQNSLDQSFNSTSLHSSSMYSQKIQDDVNNNNCSMPNVNHSSILNTSLSSSFASSSSSFSYPLSQNISNGSNGAIPKCATVKNLTPINNNNTPNYNFNKENEPQTSKCYESCAKLFERRNGYKQCNRNDGPGAIGEEVPKSYDRISTWRLLSSFYEPPKPDTPPSKIMPFWIDPVWANNEPSPTIESIDIPLPDFKPFNILQEFSPFGISLSDTFKSFNFGTSNQSSE